MITWTIWNWSIISSHSFWFIFISPIIFDIIEIFDIFWNPQMKIFFIRNFRFFQKNTSIQNWSKFWFLKIKLKFVHDLYFFHQLFSEFSIFLSDGFRYIFHNFTFFVVLTSIFKINCVNVLKCPKFAIVKIFYEFLNFDL